MSTFTLEPKWLEESPACKYLLSAFDPGGSSIQEADLTLEEYEALKRHLAERRGVVPEGGPSSVESNASGARSPEPMTATARKAIEAFDNCIDDLQDLRNRIRQEQELRNLNIHDLANAQMLQTIISDWRGGSFREQFPAELSLIASIRGNLEL